MSVLEFPLEIIEIPKGTPLSAIEETMRGRNVAYLLNHRTRRLTIPRSEFNACPLCKSAHCGCSKRDPDEYTDQLCELTGLNPEQLLHGLAMALGAAGKSMVQDG